MNIIDEIEKYSNLIDSRLEEELTSKNSYTDYIYEAMKYSAFTGGKRIRPMMALKSFELFDDDIEKIMSYAIAIEMIHTYSLIHDDLPSMDDDDYRRGKLTNHKVYGEATAILAGDGLLNLAFEVMTEYAYKNSSSFEEIKRNIRAINEIAVFSGSQGMIGGQVLDLNSSVDNIDEEKLVYMYKTKTAALIQASLVSGAIIGGGSDDEIESIREFGLYLGLAYQIKDDQLDYEEDSNIDKCTYLSFHSLEEAEDQVRNYSNMAIAALERLNGKNIEFLKGLTNLLVNRDK